MDANGANRISVAVSAECEAVCSRLRLVCPKLRPAAELELICTQDPFVLLAERSPDAFIFSHKELELAFDTAAQSQSMVLVYTGSESTDDVRLSCMRYGIMVCGENELESALYQLAAVCIKLRALRRQTYMLQRKLNDTKLISRAKLLLMSRLNMSERDAHRYIEKTAMDTGAKRSDVAARIIRTYED